MKRSRPPQFVQARLYYSIRCVIPTAKHHAPTDLEPDSRVFGVLWENHRRGVEVYDWGPS